MIGSGSEDEMKALNLCLQQFPRSMPLQIKVDDKEAQSAHTVHKKIKSFWT